MSAVRDAERLLTPEQAVQAQRLVAARLKPVAIAGILGVDQGVLLRSFRQPPPRDGDGVPAGLALSDLGYDDLEPKRIAGYGDVGR